MPLPTNWRVSISFEVKEVNAEQSAIIIQYGIDYSNVWTIDYYIIICKHVAKTSSLWLVLEEM
jgi:hypothetical protein